MYPTRCHHTMRLPLTQSAMFLDCAMEPGLLEMSLEVLYFAVRDVALNITEYLAWWDDIKMTVLTGLSSQSQPLAAPNVTEDDSDADTLAWGLEATEA